MKIREQLFTKYDVRDGHHHDQNDKRQCLVFYSAYFHLRRFVSIRTRLAPLEKSGIEGMTPSLIGPEVSRSPRNYLRNSPHHQAVRYHMFVAVHLKCSCHYSRDLSMAFGHLTPQLRPKRQHPNTRCIVGVGFTRRVQ